LPERSAKTALSSREVSMYADVIKVDMTGLHTYGWPATDTY